MNNNIEQIIRSIHRLEIDLRRALHEKQLEFLYSIDRKKVSFELGIKINHRLLIKKVRHYLLDASLLNILTAPLIWSILMPALLLDGWVSLYQLICFPVYGIPRIRRGNYIIIDRHALSYLNWIEKLNCIYCGYFNGLIGYIQEIAGRTEQFWCPIKHARRIGSMHNRYGYFFDYGDGENYREKLEEVRRAFGDLEREIEKQRGGENNDARRIR